MSQLTVTALQLGLLALLWVFVIAVVGVLRRDLFGPRVLARPTPGTRRRTTGPVPASANARTPGDRGNPAHPGGTIPTTPASPLPPTHPQRADPAGSAAGSTPSTTPSLTPPRSLVVTEGPLAGTQLPLGPSPVTMGRAPDCTLVLPDDYASSHHARLVPPTGGGSWVLEDTGSTNGTLLGRGSGTRVTGPVEVGAGSVIRIGRSVFELRR